VSTLAKATRTTGRTPAIAILDDGPSVVTRSVISTFPVYVKERKACSP
jgi:hypothetical protein